MWKAANRFFQALPDVPGQILPISENDESCAHRFLIGVPVCSLSYA
jgi:hypothetical protein